MTAQGRDPAGGGAARRARRVSVTAVFTPLTDETPVYVISVAAQLSGMHPQTLRQYDRLGIVCPDRTGGGGRRYSARDIEVLREVQRLSQDDGVNLAGIKRIRELEEQVAALTRRVQELEAQSSVFPAPRPTAEAAPGPAAPPGYRGDLLPALPEAFTTALMVWRPKGR